MGTVEFWLVGMLTCALALLPRFASLNCLCFVTFLALTIMLKLFDRIKDIE
jgi:hypothetical protein